MTDPRPVTYSITYDIVTAESAEHGDAAERGYWMPGGWRYSGGPSDGMSYREWAAEHELTADDIRDLARMAIYDGYHCDGDALRRPFGVHRLTWGGGSDDVATTREGVQGIETRHLHPEDLTPAEWALVCEWVKAGRVPDDANS